MIPDHGYSDDSYQDLIIAILNLKDYRGLRVQVEPRTIWFQEGPFKPYDESTSFTKVITHE